jgi:hypothetical protein
MPQLIVQAYELLDRDRLTCWKHGAVFHHAGCSVLVRANRELLRMDLLVWGPEQRRRSALGVVCEHLRRVHASHNELGEKPVVPLPQQPDVVVGYQYLLELEQESGSGYTWRPEGATRKYAVQELLDGVRLDAGGEDRRAPRPVAPAGASPRPAPSTWDRPVLVTIAVLFLLMILGIAIFIPTPTEHQQLVFRVLLALGAGGFGALIPGVIGFRHGAFRAGGALALFVIVYLVDPSALVASSAPTLTGPRGTTGQARELAKQHQPGDEIKPWNTSDPPSTPAVSYPRVAGDPPVPP